MAPVEDDRGRGRREWKRRARVRHRAGPHANTRHRSGRGSCRVRARRSKKAP